MPTATERVAAALASAGVAAQIIEFTGSTRTAEDAARAVGSSVGQIVKSLVFVADGEPLLALVSGANRADLGRLAALCGARAVSKADAETVRRVTGYAIGGVPPLGHAAPLRIFVDQDLLRFDRVFAAAGAPNAVFALDPQTLVRVTGGTVADLAGAG